MRVEDVRITQGCADTTPKLYQLPKGWVWTKLGDIGEINPKLKDEHFVEDTEVTFLPMKCVEELTGKIDLSLTRRLSDVRKGYTPFMNGDLLFAKITPCMENGKVVIAHDLRNGIGLGSTEFHVIRLPESFQGHFFFCFLIREDLRKAAQRNMAGSAGQLRVPANYMQQIPIPLPPLPEQHRIVAKIEELFTKLDAGVEALTKIKAQLKRYRQSVLKYAFEGKLTAEWREAHKHELEPASVLLERIKQERQKTAKGECKELPQLDTSDLPELPEGWVWTSIAGISTLVNGRAFKPSEWSIRGLPIIRIQNLNDPDADFNYCDFKVDDRFAVKDGQLLFAWSGTPGTSFGAHIWKRGTAVLNQHIFKVVINEDHIEKRFLMHVLNQNVAEFIAKAHGTAGLAHITKGRFEESAIALPPLPEQRRIVEGIERRFSVADQIERTVDNSLNQAQRLRQSVLKRAFEGKLVPQDPNDEPAEKLLERLEEERAKRQTAAKSVEAVKKKATTEEMRLM